MKIYLLCPILSGRGGMETVITTVCNGLIKRGYTVTVILLAKSYDRTWESNLPVFYTIFNDKDYSSDLTIQIPLLKNLLIEIGLPDVIISLDTSEIALAKQATMDFPTVPKIISWVHFSTHALSNIEYLSIADSHICINKAIRSQMNDLTPNIPSYLLYNPVPKSNYSVKRPKVPTILYVGRLYNKQKRIDKLLKALKKSKKYKWKLHIVGDGKDKKMLKKLASSYGILEKIKWFGWKRNPWKVVKEATVLVLPSDYEGFGLVLVEALCRGIPVIASDCLTGPSDIVKNGVNGWLFPTDDVNKLSRILKRVIIGKVKLPSSKDCKKSVLGFEEEVSLDKLEHILYLQK